MGVSMKWYQIYYISYVVNKYPPGDPNWLVARNFFLVQINSTVKGYHLDPVTKQSSPIISPSVH